MFTEYPARFSAHLSLHGFHPERYLSLMFSQNGQSDNSTFMRQDARPCRMVSAVIHERLCLFIPAPFQSLFFGTFSLQAARIMRSQAGIHPGRLFSFQGVNVCIGMAIIASYTYWAPEDRNVSCSEKIWNFTSVPWIPFQFISSSSKAIFFLCISPRTNEVTNTAKETRPGNK